jgi:hypothetical protein
MNTPDRNHNRAQIGWDFTHDGVGADFPAVKLTVSNDARGITIDQNGDLQAIYIDHDDTGTTASIEIDRDGNNAADIAGIKITVDNAGAGSVVGIDFSGFAALEPLFQFTSDTDASSKSPETDAQDDWFVVTDGTNVRAVPVYALS